MLRFDVHWILEDRVQIQRAISQIDRHQDVMTADEAPQSVTNERFAGICGWLAPRYGLQLGRGRGFWLDGHLRVDRSFGTGSEVIYYSGVLVLLDGKVVFLTGNYLALKRAPVSPLRWPPPLAWSCWSARK